MIHFLDSNEYKNRNGDIECILAAGVIDKIPFTTENSFKKLDSFISKVNDWIFGFLSFELKNEIEDLNSKNSTTFNTPNLFFFQPKKIWIIKSHTIEAHYLSEVDILMIGIHKFNSITNNKVKNKKINFSPQLKRLDYIKKINKILSHIKRGDIYEVNFCKEWIVKGKEIDPESVFRKLNKISKSPMSGFFRDKNFFLISSSPERFIKKTGKK